MLPGVNPPAAALAAASLRLRRLTPPGTDGCCSTGPGSGTKLLLDGVLLSAAAAPAVAAAEAAAAACSSTIGIHQYSSMCGVVWCGVWWLMMVMRCVHAYSMAVWTAMTTELYDTQCMTVTTYNARVQHGAAWC